MGLIIKPAALCQLLLHCPDPLLIVRLLWMDQLEIMLSMQSVVQQQSREMLYTACSNEPSLWMSQAMDVVQ